MPPRHESLPAFPSSLYGKYKQATQFFLDWLLRARSVGVGADSNATVAKKGKLKEGVALAVYHEIVVAIAREPTALPPSLLQLWTRALEACETAITLRARVALFFPAKTTKANDSHAHFLERLSSWLKTLKQAETPVVTMANAHVADEAPLDFSNYYSVLELPDDYFPAEMEEDKSVSAISRADLEAERKRLFDDDFEKDLNVELSFLFMELEELSEAVYDAFLDVKRHKKTLVEATAVAKIAIDCAESVIAKLQLRFPSIRTAQDMMTMIQDRIPSKQLMKLLDAVQAAWTPSERPSQTPKSQYVAGTIVADMLWISRALQSFAAIPIAPNANLVIRGDFFGEMYSEERTPHYCAPNMAATPSFLMHQLPLLYNTLLANRTTGVQQDTSSLSGWFLDRVDQFFTKRSASIHFVFITICWIRSVSALQGEGGLGRNISLSIMHRWDIEERLSASIAHGEVLRADPPLHEEMEEALANMKQLDKANVLLRANPLLAGFMMLDCQFRLIHLGTETLLITSRFRAFGHIYNALRDRRLLDAIPLVEEMMQVYEATVFTPSRSAAVQGAYTRTYLVSSHMTEAAVDAMFGRRPPPPAHLASCIRPLYHLPDLSRVFRLLKNKDFSVLPTVSATASWKMLLSAVSDLCTKELFESRVLSRDMVKFSDDLTDTFDSLCDILRRRGDADRILAQGIPGMPRQYVVNRVLEDVVVMPLLPFLDCLNHDGSIRVADDAADVLQLESARAMLLTLGGSGAIEAYCRRAAELISRRFSQREPTDIEAAYFSFPCVPEWSALEFGDASLHSESQHGETHGMFVSLLEMMEQSGGPLRQDDLERIKNLIIIDPAILASGAVESTTELCTLLHQAAAGPARDRRLVEWLLQMGGLHHQPMHCRHPPSQQVLASMGVDSSHLPNALAVHSAAKAGLEDMVRLLLEADHMRDLNTTTFHTRESLAHIAVKHGHRNVYDLLHAMGADLRHKDASGKFVYDLTSDPSWKRKILEMAVQQRREEEKMQAHKSRDPQLRRESEAAAEQLRQALVRQREAERVKSQPPKSRGSRPATRTSPNATAQVASATPISPATEPVASDIGVTTSSNAVAATSRSRTSGSKSKKKKKNKKKAAKKESTGSTSLSETASLMQQLVVGRGEAREADAENVSAEQEHALSRTEQLGRALDMLKEGVPASSAERERSAKQALEIVDSIKTTIQHIATRNANHDLLPSLREQIGLEASRAVFLLNKFHRQLPEQRLSRADFWKKKPEEATASSYEKLVKRAGPPFDFGDFLALSVHTARVLASNGRVPQAKEVLDLLERRLLKMKQRSPVFRKYVEAYALARRRAGLEPVEGSTPEARRAFEWYLGNYSGFDDSMALIGIDQLCGFQWFHKLKPAEGTSSREFNRFADLLDGVGAGGVRNPVLDRVVFVDDYIVVGADTFEEATIILTLLLELAQQSGLHIVLADTEFAKKTLTMVGFEFSATGIVRVE